VRIVRGTVLRPHPDVSVGLVEVAREPEALAWLSVGLGPYAYRVFLRRGERLHVAGGVLELTELEAGGDVVGRWVTPVPADAPAKPVALEDEQGWELPDMGLYSLPGGRVLGVGNVRRSAAVGASPEAGVTLMLYPAGYASDPSLGYDLHEEARPGALSGEVGELRVERVEIGRPPRRGRVLVRIP
jgi:hypothetical protein